MAGSGNLLSTAVSGLQAFQQNLATIGHNITNVNTEGYSRQSVEMAPRTPNAFGSGFLGTGVEVTTIQRVYDQFIFDQITTRNTSFNQLDTLQNLASGIDELLANEQAGVNPTIQNFFNALQDVANNPTSASARQVMVSEAETLSNRFQSLDQRFSDLRGSINDQLGAIAGEVNSLAASIAGLNQKITLERGLSGGQPPNDLLDARDRLINQLSELVAVSTVEQESGAVNVFIGNGQSLVLGNTTNSIGITSNAYDQSQQEVSFITPTTNFEISAQLNGGKLGGLLAFREQVLDPVQNAMGRIAIALADTFNTQHQLGDDINGNPGGLFFNDIVATSPKVFASSRNDPTSGTVSVAINDSNLIQASDYRLNYDGASFSLTRLSDNTVVDSGFVVADFPRAVASDGITLDLVGSVAAGDSFLIRPVREGGGDIAVQLTQTDEFAAAASGNALGDNTNVLALIALQSGKMLGGGTETFQSAYSKLVGKVGVATREARVNAGAQETLLGRAIEAQQALSGVNLDEEAANLIKFQQAYQAAAQVIRIADDIFQTLLSVTSR
jgi:flagellar hook-associated protein 1 FlgK